MLLNLDRITVDEELQPRACIDAGLMDEYAQHIVDGGVFPPVIAFDDGAAIWLADGFHRWHTHKALGIAEIEADVRAGSREAALRHSLAANAEHGARRKPADYRRAYDVACRNGLVDAQDSDAVHALLRCSGRWADELTADARVQARVARDAAIVKAAAEGKSNRQIAREVGVAEGTVRNVGAQKKNGAEIAHPTTPPPDRPAWVDKMDELKSAPAKAWSGALSALRKVNEQTSVDELFADRFDGFDCAVMPELESAFAWISDFHRRFHDARSAGQAAEGLRSRRH